MNAMPPDPKPDPIFCTVCRERIEEDPTVPGREPSPDDGVCLSCFDDEAERIAAAPSSMRKSWLVSREEGAD